MKNTSFLSGIKADLPAGLVVALIAIPLCLGIALASGAPLFSGMIAGIIGGIVVGAFSSSHTSVSGPAAGLTAVVLVAIQELGAYPAFLLAVLLAGVFQFVLGALKAGGVANYFPNSVIKGMLSAIGIIIILKQIPHALGYDKDAEGDLTFLQPDGDNTFSAIWHSLDAYVHPGALTVTIVAILLMVFWEKSALKQRFSFIPGALLAVLVSVGLNVLFQKIGGSWAIQPEHLVQIPVASNFQSFLNLFTFPDFSQWQNPAVWRIAFTLFAIASIETLLSIEAVDKLDPHRRHSDPNQELKAQGIGNFVSGLIGGLPITSVIVRSSANVDAGAESKGSAIYHGMILLFCVSLIPGMLNMIPLASLAAILLLTGYKLTKISIFKSMWQNGKYQWWPFIITVVAVVFTDLLTGVLIGLGASVFAILRGNMKNAYFFHKEEYHEGDLINIKLSEEVSFLNKAAIKLTLDHLPLGSKAMIDASNTAYIDHDVLELIREFQTVIAPEKGIQLTLKGFRAQYKLQDADFVHAIASQPPS